MKEEHIFCLFVPGVTQGNEDVGWDQDFNFFLLARLPTFGHFFPWGFKFSLLFTSSLITLPPSKQKWVIQVGESKEKNQKLEIRASKVANKIVIETGEFNEKIC